MKVNNNEQEIPQVQHEWFALKLDARAFAFRSKAKAKPQRRQPVGFFTENRSHWKKELDWYWTREIFFLRMSGIEESNVSSSSFTTNALRRRWSDSFLVKERKSSESIPQFCSLVWRSMKSMVGSRRSKKETPVLYRWFRNNCFFQSSSRTFRTQSSCSFIAGQCRFSEQLLAAYLPIWMWIQSWFYHQLWINTWRSKFEQETQYSSSLWILWTKITRILRWSIWVYSVVHNTCTKHGRDLKTEKIGSTSIFRLRKDWHSVRFDRMLSSFKKHFQLIVFRKLLGWKLEKVNKRKFLRHLDFRLRSLSNTNGRETWVQNTVFQHIYYIGCAFNLHSIINNGLIPGGQNSSKRQTVFFLPIDHRDEGHKDPEKIDLNVPRRAQYLHSAWKKHQDAVHRVDIDLEIRKGLTFYQTRSNAIILPAYCIPKVVRLKIENVLYEKVCMSPRLLSKISFGTRMEERTRFRSRSTINFKSNSWEIGATRYHAWRDRCATWKENVPFSGDRC